MITKGAWQCQNCGYWAEGHSDAREAPFGVCVRCFRSMTFYADPSQQKGSRMTENEFIKLCTDVDFLNQVGKDNVLAVAYEALRIAKALGANFDPEPVNLPPLAYEIIAGIGSYIRLHVPTDGTVRCLTDKEAKEIVRRCHVVSVLREFLKPHTSVTTRAVLDILDGKMVGSRSVEDGHAL